MLPGRCPIRGQRLGELPLEAHPGRGRIFSRTESGGPSPSGWPNSSLKASSDHVCLLGGLGVVLGVFARNPALPGAYPGRPG